MEKHPASKLSFRSSRLNSVRQTLSKFNAKYSKSSFFLNDDLSDGNNGLKEITFHEESMSSQEIQNITKIESDEPMPAPHFGQSQGITTLRAETDGPLIFNRPEFSHTLLDSMRDDSIHSNEDNSYLEAVSSIESVKTDSKFDLDNVHSVSSLADSILPLEEMEGKESPELLERKESSELLENVHSVSSLAESIVPFGKQEVNKSSHALLVISSRNGEANCREFSDSSSAIDSSMHPYKVDWNSEDNRHQTDLSNKKYADRLRSVSKPNCYSSPPAKLLLEIEPKASDIMKRGLARELSSLNVHGDSLAAKQSDDNGDSTIVGLPTEKFKPVKNLPHCSDDLFTQRKMTSVAVQTSNDSENSIKNTQINWEQPRSRSTSSVRCSTDTPVIKSLSLPRFLQDVTQKFESQFMFSQHKGIPCFVENETCQLLSYHLHLIKEYLERQHRAYIANCKAVQVLERGYQELALQRKTEDANRKNYNKNYSRKHE